MTDTCLINPIIGEAQQPVAEDTDTTNQENEA